MLWKNYKYLSKKYGLKSEKIMEPNELRNITHLAEEVLEIEKLSNLESLSFGSSPISIMNQKIKKEENHDLMIHLSLNPDILFDLGQKKTHQFLVGFAAETNDVIAHGRNKVERKNLDMLIANDVAMPGAGFNVTTNIAAILYKDGTLQQYPKMAKEELGKIIIEKIAEKCN